MKEIKSEGGGDIFYATKHAGQIWDPLSLILDGYQKSLPFGKVAQMLKLILSYRPNH